jgi:hypothetical protein
MTPQQFIAKNILLLRQVFTNPDALKPDQTQTNVTEEVAGRFARLAEGMTARGIPPQQAAHFLMKLMFCMFAEDIELLPRGLFSRTVTNAKDGRVHVSKLDLFPASGTIVKSVKVSAEFRGRFWTSQTNSAHILRRTMKPGSGNLGVARWGSLAAPGPEWHRKMVVGSGAGC